MNYVHAHQMLMSSLPLSFPSPHILIICRRFFPVRWFPLWKDIFYILDQDRVGKVTMREFFSVAWNDVWESSRVVSAGGW